MPHASLSSFSVCLCFFLSLSLCLFLPVCLTVTLSLSLSVLEDHPDPLVQVEMFLSGYLSLVLSFSHNASLFGVCPPVRL